MSWGEEKKIGERTEKRLVKGKTKKKQKFNGLIMISLMAIMILKFWVKWFQCLKLYSNFERGKFGQINWNLRVF